MTDDINGTLEAWLQFGDGSPSLFDFWHRVSTGETPGVQLAVFEEGAAQVRATPWLFPPGDAMPLAEHHLRFLGMTMVSLDARRRAGGYARIRLVCPHADRMVNQPLEWSEKFGVGAGPWQETVLPHIVVTDWLKVASGRAILTWEERSGFADDVVALFGKTNMELWETWLRKGNEA